MKKGIAKVLCGMLSITCLSFVITPFATNAFAATGPQGIIADPTTSDETLADTNSLKGSSVDSIALEESRSLIAKDVDPSLKPSQQQEIKAKVLAAMLRTGGKTLELLLKPFSPTKSALVKKYADKIAGVLDKVEVTSRQYMVTALTKVGIPKTNAEDITEIILWLLL